MSERGNSKGENHTNDDGVASPSSMLSHLEPAVQQALDRQADRQKERPQPLNVIPDEPDLRDLLYTPGLIPLVTELPIPDYLWPLDSLCSSCIAHGSCRYAVSFDSSSQPKSAARVEHERRRLIRNQGGEGSCTGQALATVIDIQLLRRQFGRPTGCYQQLIQQPKELDDWLEHRVSARMLYEMARNYEFAPESQLPGSTIRNALKAFHHNGVCSENISEYTAGDVGWALTLDRAINARGTRLGTYMRVDSDILDWQAALNEVGALMASAIIHEGWNNLEVADDTQDGEDVSARFRCITPNQIPFTGKDTQYLGGHAFAVVGYNAEGFYVLNSWGGNWGRVLDKDDQIVCKGVPGVALWRYEDWQHHVFDAWVFRLAHPASGLIGRKGGWRQQLNPISGQKISSEPRQSINGHYLNLCSTGYVRRGKYPSDANSTQVTRTHLVEKEKSISNDDESGPYHGLVICFMHGAANINSTARRIDGLTWLLKQQRLYPYFVFWNYADVSHISNIVDANHKTLLERYGKSDPALQIRFDRDFREFGQLFGTRMMSQIDLLNNSQKPEGNALHTALEPLLTWASDSNKPIHFIAHSDGTLLLDRYLLALKSRSKSLYKNVKNAVGSYYLLAPTAIKKGLQNIEKCRNRGVQINIVTLSAEDDLSDTIGRYQGGYPRLIQNVFFPNANKKPERKVLGLPEHASALALTPSQKKSSVYRHIEAPRSTVKGPSMHFELTGNQLLMQAIAKELGTVAEKT
ncbi:C1 family peptidase [Granulosicoccus sp.]|nr:C1 family peptidase [Granulosicoccus sp.]MDB4222950.1 C1 family peptidase [Granulosicoccus sp.]